MKVNINRNRWRYSRALLLFSLGFPACASLRAEKPFLEKQALFQELGDGFAVYRIPGLVVTAKGTVLAYCEARKFTGADRGEIEVHLRRSTDGGRTWGPPVQVAHRGPRLPRNPHMPKGKEEKDMGGPNEQTVNNPVAIASRDGAVHLLYCVEYMRSFYMRSDDDCVTWSEPVEITSTFDKFRPELDWQVIATGPGHGIQLTSGRLIVPFWLATYEKSPSLRKAAATIFSDDNGRTWQKGDLAMPEGNEAIAAELSDGGVVLSARNSSDRRLVAYSPDGATAWSKAELIADLPEPGCMAGLVRYAIPPFEKKPLLIYSNPYTTDRDHKARTNVTIQLSRDDGRTWPTRRLLQEGPSAYSDLAVLPDGTILCFYESGGPNPPKQYKRPWPYSYLTLARFNLAWLTESESPDKAPRQPTIPQ